MHQHTFLDTPATTGARTWRPRVAFALLLSYFALFGITFGVHGVIWADVVRRLSLSEGIFGTAQLSAPLVSVVLLLQAGPLGARFSMKQLALVGVVAQVAAQVWLALAGDLAGLVGALLLVGAGFGLIEMAMNSATLDWEHATGRPVMNLMHAGFSGGAVIGALVAGALLGAGLSYPQVLAGLAAVYGLVFALSIPVRYPPPHPEHVEVRGAGATLRLLAGPALALLAVICMFGTLGESIVNLWAVIYLRDLGAPTFIGGAAFALFNGTMFVGRLANATLVARLGERASLLTSGALLLCAGLILIGSEAIWPVVGAFALLGLAVAGVVPTVLSAAARIAPGNSAAITGAIMAVAYVSFIVSPPLIGWAAEIFSLRAALGLAALTGIALLLLVRRVPALA